MQHCAGGRDRTGIGSMLIQLTLGVPYEAVMEDYLLSNITLAEFHQELYTSASGYLDPAEMTAFRSAMELQPRYLEASMGAIIQHYESFERYLEAEFGIDAQIRQSIQDYCLE